jgi:hypothetical protein
VRASVPTHPWRLLVAAIALPGLVGLAVLAFAWPAARTAPRDVPVGILGTSPAAGSAVEHLDSMEPDAFDFRFYVDPAGAVSAIHDRAVDGAFDVEPDSITVYTAGAASPAIAQLLATAGAGLAAQAHVPARADDVVPLSAADPRGTVFSAALLPLTICGVAIAATVAVVLGFRPAWRQVLALAVISGSTALGAYFVAQGLLGALPHHAVATWAALTVTIFAISAAVAGSFAVLGVPGLGVGAALMVFVGNPFSGASSAPELLPDAANHFGQWLPPGAEVSLLRSTAYFDGNGAAPHLGVLVAWAVGGVGLIILGHHTSLGRSGRSEADNVSAQVRAEPLTLPADRSVDVEARRSGLRAECLPGS